MEKTLDFSTILVELDALFDTRIAAIDQLGEDSLKTVLDGGYYTRIIDEFPGIDNEAFKEIYKSKSKSLLFNSMITPIAEYLLDFSIKTLAQVATSPFHNKPKIIVNTYPYDLNEIEIDIIARGVRGITRGKADIEMVNLSYADITPKYLKKNISILILYNYPDWLEKQSELGNFPTTTCPKVALFGPAIYFKPINPNEYFENNPFETLELYVSPLISLNLLPVEKFSLIMRPDKID